MELPHFVLFGCGDVVKKYWVPAWQAGLVEIVGIVSRERVESLPWLPAILRGRYRRIGKGASIESCAAQLVKGSETAVAVLTPASVRLEVVKTLSELFPQNLLYIEKSYANSVYEVRQYREALGNYGGQWRFANPYGNARIRQLVKRLRLLGVPMRVEGKLFEGQEFFFGISQRRRETYLAEGPELDLGFHLLAALAAGIGKVETIRIVTTGDLAGQHWAFLEGYGFLAELMMTAYGKEVPVSIAAGKADMETERFVAFYYPKGVIRQRFMPSGEDLLEVEWEGEVSEERLPLPKLSHYWAGVENCLAFGQSRGLKERLLRINEVCLELRHARLQPGEEGISFLGVSL